MEADAVVARPLAFACTATFFSRPPTSASSSAIRVAAILAARSLSLLFVRRVALARTSFSTKARNSPLLTFGTAVAAMGLSAAGDLMSVDAPCLAIPERERVADRGQREWARELERITVVTRVPVRQAEIPTDRLGLVPASRGAQRRSRQAPRPERLAEPPAGQEPMHLG